VQLMQKFPGFFVEDPYFFAPSNPPHVLQNLYKRLQDKKVRLNPSQEVQVLLQTRPKILKIPENFKFHTQPKPHQEIALRFLYTFRKFGLLMEPGMGKTKVVLDHLLLTQDLPALIVCPAALTFVWEQEAKTHRPEINTYILKSTDWTLESEQIPKDHSNLAVIVNYNKAVILEKQLQQLQWKSLIVDEGLIKDPTTERTQSIQRLAKSRTIKSKIIMSGTLINNSPLDMFSPAKFLEPSLVGSSFYKFKDEYVVYARQKPQPGIKTPKIVVAYRKIPEVKDILQTVSLVMTKDEWLTLPKKVFHDVIVQMDDVQRKFYWDLASNYTAKLPDGRDLDVENPLTMLSKLTQVSSGFVYFQEQTSDLTDLFLSPADLKKRPKKKREVVFFPSQPKIQALLTLTQTQLKSERFVLWYNLTSERVLIEDALTAVNVKFATIAGGEKDVGQKVGQFNTDPSVHILVCQAKSINYGVTLTGTQQEDESDIVPSLSTDVCNMVFYSLGFSLEVYLQQQDRIHRMSQTRECHYWRILCNTPLEDKVTKRLDEKLSLNKAILVDIAETLKNLRGNEHET